MYDDIYFEEEYGKLSERIEEGESVVFHYDTPLGRIRNLFIKRPLPQELDAQRKYFDIITPYGYGGPLILESKGDERKLVEAFSKDFNDYCKAHHIISEFVRFHPLIQNEKSFKNIYDIAYSRDTIATRIEGVEDPFLEEFSKGVRKVVRRSLREGVTYEIIEQPADLQTFLAIYYETMDRNESSTFYYFPKGYFQYLCQHLREYFININVYYENTCIASGLYSIYNRIMQSYLSGTKTEFLSLSPAYVLKYAQLNWAIDNGVRLIHHGGGTTNDPNDPLLQFKKKFSRSEPFQFHVGKRIHDEEIYQSMVARSGKEETGFFPRYRG